MEIGSLITVFDVREAAEEASRPGDRNTRPEGKWAGVGRMGAVAVAVVLVGGAHWDSGRRVVSRRGRERRWRVRRGRERRRRRGGVLLVS